MNKYLTLALITSGFATSLNAFAQTELTTKTRSTFIEPIEMKISVLPEREMPSFCAASDLGVQCPSVIGGTSGPRFPSDGPIITTGYKNVRVSMYIDKITNKEISGGGVDNLPNYKFAEWFTTSPDADVELTGPYNWSLPEPGNSYDEFGPHGSYFGLKVYDALVFGECGSFNDFDIEHDATVTTLAVDLGNFHGVDTSTINKTGYYNVNYTVRAEDTDGGVSEFQFSGELHAVCSGANSL